MRRATSALIASVLALAAHSILAQDAKLRTIHVFVALADNEHQGIVPVAATLGQRRGCRAQSVLGISLRRQDIFLAITGMGAAELRSEA